jgi:DNA-binding NtrC family response regulator
MAEHFILNKCREMNLPVPPMPDSTEIQALLSYPWPGNVRALQNLIERALILSKGGPLTFSGLLPETSAPQQPVRDHGSFLTLDDAMARHISNALDITGGKISGDDGAARILNIHANTLRSRMQKLGFVRGNTFTRSSKTSRNIKPS